MDRDEQEIREMVAEWIRASKEGDTKTVLSLMSDDVVFLVAGQAPMIGKNAFEAAGARRPANLDIQCDIREITVLEEWAWMWTDLTVSMARAPGEPRTTMKGNTLSILRKLNGRWVIARDANALTPVA
ncbi:MAG TPA: SgcJ/EcaC family oxidoreductase [Chthonomonadales bacterium]|nr:SgcJ/EcaC family oxidoreductase [Chthonomonadales bacterium]